MDYPPVFLKSRAIAFSLISLICFIWIVILCVDIFIQWDALGTSEKSFLGIMLLSDTLTLILLLVLLLLPFRPWLDAARMLLLLVSQIGIASAFVVWNSSFSCPDKTTDEEGVCRLLNMLILIANWLIPALLIIYCLGLALMVYRRKKSAVAFTEDFESTSRESSQSILPMMKPQGHPEGVRHPSMSTLHDSIVSQPRRGSGSVVNLTRQFPLPPSTPQDSRHQSMLTVHDSVVRPPRRASASVPRSSRQSMTPEAKPRHPSMPPLHTSFIGQPHRLSASPVATRQSMFPKTKPEETRRPSLSTLHNSIISYPRSESASASKTSSSSSLDRHFAPVAAGDSSKGRLSKPTQPSWMMYH